MLMFWCFLIALSLFFRGNAGVHISAFTTSKIEKAIKAFEEGKHRVSLLKEWPSPLSETPDEYLSPPVLIWDVLKSYESIVSSADCPFCKKHGKSRSCVRRAGLWTDGKTAYSPRVIYDTNGWFLLVSAVYTCNINHQIPSQHPEMLSSLPSNVYVPFFLTNRAGFSPELLTEISLLVDHGLSFLSIEDIVRDRYHQGYHRLKARYEEDMRTRGHEELGFPEFQQASFPYPHNTIIRDVFSAYSALFDELFSNDMDGRISEWIFCDHTFKSAANIGFVRESDGKWIKLFRSVFIILGEGGDILHWKFTRGESLNEVRDMLLQLKNRLERKGERLKGIVIDNCCKWSALLVEIFHGVAVKLDLFHAVQRFLKALPIGARIGSGIAKEYGLIFRQRTDIKDRRTMPTAPSTEILRNLASFQEKWSLKKWNGQPVLNDNAKKAMGNLKLHIEKGCLSDIPIHCTTSRNERLHREMNSVLRTNRIGLELAYLRCVRLFFRMNNNKDIQAQQLSYPRFQGSKRNNCYFGVEKNMNIWDCNTAFWGGKSMSLKELSSDNIFIIKDIIRSSIVPSSLDSDHMYCSTELSIQETAKEILLDALNFYEVYRRLCSIGGTRFLSESRIPNSIGLQNNAAEKLKSIHTESQEKSSHSDAQSVLLGHIQGFGLDVIPIPGDGNCFFSAVAFQLQQLVVSATLPMDVQHHLSSLGISTNVTTPDLARALRLLTVEEWQGPYAEDYIGYLPLDVDFDSEVSNFKNDGYFHGPLGDLMAMTVSNVLQLPLCIITSATHTPFISVCPRRALNGALTILLAYNSYGAGHYDAVVEQRNTSGAESPNLEQAEGKMCNLGHNISQEIKEVTRSCRCGSMLRKSKPAKRRYKVENRCKCILKHGQCSRLCKCKGQCGGRKCKHIVFTTRSKPGTLPKHKHILQKSRKSLNLHAILSSSTLNFLEVCLVCAIIQFFKRSGQKHEEKDIHTMYNAVIDSLLLIGIMLPLESRPLETIRKEYRKMRKNFDDK